MLNVGVLVVVVVVVVVLNCKLQAIELRAIKHFMANHNEIYAFRPISVSLL